MTYLATSLKLAKFSVTELKVVDGRRYESGFTYIRYLSRNSDSLRLLATIIPIQIRFRRKLVCRREFCFRECCHDDISKFSESNMADGDERHLENRFSAIYRRILPDECEIRNAQIESHDETCHQTRIANFK